MSLSHRFRLRGGLRALAASVAGAALIAGALVTAPAASADTAPAAGVPATVSADPLPTVQINGVVWDQVVVGNTVYAVGSFSSARPAGSPPGKNETPRGNVVSYDIRTGVMNSFAPMLNAQARTIAASSDGSTIYIGGDFTTVDGSPAYRIAAFSTATGQRITSFAPTAGSSVTSISTSSKAVYLGGFFKTVNGQVRQGLAAVSPSGALLPWTAPVAGGTVAAVLVAPDQSRVIVAGSFTSVNGATAYGSASVDATSGASMPWAANSAIPNGKVPSGSTGGIFSLSTDGQSIFGTGWNYGNNPNPFLEGAFAADPTTGNVRWVEDCNGDTYSSTPVNGVLYTVGHAHNCQAGGWFGNANDSTGALQHWNSLAFTTASSGTTNASKDQYGNDFTGYQTPSLLQWFPKWLVGTYTGQYQAGWTIESNSQYVVVGGEFQKVGNKVQQGLVRFAVSSVAPNKVGPQTPTTPPVAAVTQTNGQFTVTVSAPATWDPDNNQLTYSLVRNAGTSSQTTVGTPQTVGSTFWQTPTVTLTDTSVPANQQYTYTLQVTDPFGNTVSYPVSTASTAPWSAISGQTSSAYTNYVATVGTSTLSGRTLTVPFTATGPNDLRRPESTCLTNGNVTIQPSLVNLTTDQAGSFAGTLTYQLPQAGSYTLQYACYGPYSQAPVGSWTGQTAPMGANTSSAFDGQYMATVGQAALNGTTLTVPFTAVGPSDLRRPEGTCITDGTKTVSPTSTSLTTDHPGGFAGTLTYTLPESGTYTLQYSCYGAYSQAAVGTYAVAKPPAWTPTTGSQSVAYTNYVATVGQSTLNGTTLTVGFTAQGPSDLRQPGTTCLNTNGVSLQPTAVNLTTNQAGSFAGTLTYQLSQPGTYTLQYACYGPYSQAQVGTYAP